MKKILPLGIVLVMMITTVTGCSFVRVGQLFDPASDQSIVLIQHQVESILQTNKDTVSFEVPIDLIPIPESTQREIRRLCEEKRLAYELVLAILLTDAHYYARMDELEAVIEELASYRDYWTAEDYPDEIVFDLLILSAQRGIEGCKSFITENNAFGQDDYIQKVTAYKYYLDQQNTNNVFMTQL